MFAIMFAAALAATGPTPAERGPLIAAADVFDQAQIDKNRATLERMTLDSLVFIDGSGKRQGKAAFIAGWMGPGDRYDPITLVDRQVTMLGRDAGVVGAEVNLCGTSDGTRFCSRFRFADTFVRIAGRWRVAHIQVTRMK